jgi:hypothetical protein
MAIKVNGTTVINDSRALTNISSVDATTVAAFGAAGVGGGLDGTTAFTLLASQGTDRITGIAYNGTQFIAASRDTSGVVYTSPDGLRWSKNTGPTSMAIHSVAANGNTFVCGGNTGDFTTSTNGGSSWGVYSKGNNRQIFGITFEQGNFIAACEAASIYTSSNGTSWTERKSPTGGSDYYAVAGNGSLVVAVGDSGVLGTSTTGTSGWTARSSGTVENLGGVTYGNGMWVAVGSGTIITSTNGTSWTTRTSYTTQYLDDVAWTGSEFIAVGASGVCVNSPDGITWTPYSGGNNTASNESIVVAEGIIVVGGYVGKVMVASS